MMYIRANNKDSVCVYCGYNIGMAIKCNCGTIDPPVKSPPISQTKEQLIIADLQDLINSLPKYDNMRVREKLEEIVSKYETTKT